MIKYIEKSIGRKESGQYMNRYDYIIFDIDDTLFQYKKAERHIMSRIFEEENQSMRNCGHYPGNTGTVTI